MTTEQNGSTGMETEEAGFPMEAWDAIAEGYDRHVAPLEADLAKEALALVGLRSGERFLDVAGGTGGLGFHAARMGAEVLVVDWSPTMIERFHARAREEGLWAADGRVMDCHALDLEDNSFDVTASQFGVMQELRDGTRALREMVRVTRPGGKVMLIVYGPMEKFESVMFFVDALMTVVPDFRPPPDDPQWASDPVELARRMTAAGLKDVKVETTAERVRFRSMGEMWNWLMHGNPLAGIIVADLTEEQRAEMQNALDRMHLERAEGGDSAVLSNEVNIAIGTK
jgi:ubiquinone/menaquinone biosynthesis C-methylase UbiE